MFCITHPTVSYKMFAFRAQDILDPGLLYAMAVNGMAVTQEIDVDTVSVQTGST